MNGAAAIALLPRLLYLGDVPVESSYHGSALLYRLLETYPPERLLVIEEDGAQSQPERRLTNVRYRALAAGGARLRHTRLHPWLSMWSSLRAASWSRRVPALLEGFAPQAVLTVAHGHRWVAAAAVAERLHIPLHLIVHDDWPRIASLPWPLAGRVDRQFGAIYRAATSRLCVSPWMAEEYRRRYGAEGRVLYPSRARGAVAHAAPPGRLEETGRPLTFAFAGTINTPDYYSAIAGLARAAQPAGGRVLVFGPVDANQGPARGLDAGNIQFCGLLPSADLIARLRAEVDVLFVPMSFSGHEAEHVRFSFPSKLTDYTAAGLPLLVSGPPGCAAVRWARDNPGVAEVVDSNDPARLRNAVERLATDPAHRVSLAVRAIDVGQRMFSPQASWDVFAAAVTGAPAPVHGGCS